ncbi:MAG: ATP-binding cassette domain-containing protein, partial [Chloroflexi bacterium]|nr:ATP-binding cassette domain-containing protein [Chloroflexota bacterium]
MIEVQGLSKTYGDVPALRDVSFRIERGEVVGFLGPNGAGKTTTMRILSGYLPPSGGTASIAGFDVQRDSLEVRRRIGYLPETVPLYPEMSVQSYLEFMATLRRVAKPRPAAQTAMERLRIADRAGQEIGKLSKGYRQRVGLDQALIHDPEVLILDEPTIGLDPKQIIEVRELIRELGADHTVILSTHILPEVEQTCQRVLIINDGQLVAEDTPARLTTRLKGAERIHIQVAEDHAGGVALEGLAEALGQVPGVAAVEALGSGVFEVESALEQDLRPRLARRIVEGGWALLEIRPVGMSLEEIFLKL